MQNETHQLAVIVCEANRPVTQNVARCLTHARCRLHDPEVLMYLNTVTCNDRRMEGGLFMDEWG